MTEQRPALVVVDDEPGVLDVLSRFARRLGFDVAACGSGAEAMEYLRNHRADLVMVDLRMPDVGGIEVLRMIRETDPHCQTVLMTGYASVDTAVQTIKLGALDYLSKPFDFPRLERLLRGVREEAERRRQVLTVERAAVSALEFCGMIGRSAVMQDLFGMIRRLAPHVRTALITGETGTGKELAARALHHTGPQSEGPFLVVNCAGVDEAMFDAELFGRAPGGSADAAEAKPGLFEQAAGGTLFFDEIADLPLGLQGKLLRVFETGEITRLGSLEPQQVHVKVLAATTRDLRAEVAARRFRGELYYRLTLVHIEVPPLRDRREDVPYLTAAFVRDAAERLQKPLAGLTAGAERRLATAAWEGNVRELKNVIERACILADGEFVSERDLGNSLALPTAASSEAAAALPDDNLLTTVERDHIQRALQRAGGNKKLAAEMLGVSRRALYRRLERLKLDGTITRRSRGWNAPPADVLRAG